MNPKSAPPAPAAAPDPQIAALAARQHGVVTRQQLTELGLGPTGVRARLRTRRLIALHRGVYAVGHARLRREGRWYAAVLACGPGAVLSHADAAAMWQIRASSSPSIHVTVPSRNGRKRRPGIRIHRPRRLAPEEVTAIDGIPVTTVARTLLDLADVLKGQGLKRAIDEADYLRLLDMTSLTAVVDRNPGRRAARLLALAKAPAERTRTQLEARALGIVERHELPKPKVNHPLLGYEIDLLWPEAKLAVELDGYGAHGTRKAFQADRERDRRLIAAGYRPIRFTNEDLKDGSAVARELRRLLRSSAG